MFVENLKQSSKLMLSAGVISIPMLALGGGPLTIPGSGLGNCTYSSFELSSTGNLILNLDNVSCLGTATTGGDTGTTGGDTGTTGGDTGTTGGDTGTTGGDTGTTGGDTGTGEHYSDPNALQKYAINKTYSSKADFDKTSIPNDPDVTVYIVNHARSSVAQPHCVNGESTLHCFEKYGLEGAKRNEIYAIRLLTKDGASTPSIRTGPNEFTGGRANYATWEYTLSEKPGEMIPGGGCSFSNEGNKSRLYANLGSRNPYYTCEIPENTMMYLNARIAEKSAANCETSNCTDYLLTKDFKY